jgi:hypothetical protein
MMTRLRRKAVATNAMNCCAASLLLLATHVFHATDLRPMPAGRTIGASCDAPARSELPVTPLPIGAS